MAEENAVEEQPTMGELMQLVHQQGNKLPL